MHELYTSGINYYQDMRLPIKIVMNADFIFSKKSKPRFCVLSIDRGSGILKINNKNYIFVAPSLFCLNNREIPVLTEQNTLQIRTLYFHPEILNSEFTLENVYSDNEFSRTASLDRYMLLSFIKRDKKNSCMISTSMPATVRGSSLFDKIQSELEQQPNTFWPCRSRSFVIELLYLIRSIPSFSDEDMQDHIRPDNPLLGRILLFLHTHYEDAISLNEIAEQFNTNRTTLNDLFKKHLGKPVISYLAHYRINLAKQILHDTTLTVNEIMYRVGFNDKSHFSRTFKKLTNRTPSAYRKAYSWFVN